MIKEEFGQLSTGATVERYTLERGGLRVRILTYGCAVQTIEVPDRSGELGNVVLGCATAADYETKSRFFGAVVGRYGNRIAGGRFSLDGSVFELPVNNGPNSLHGGGHGFDKQVWDAVALDEHTLSLSYVSADGEAGYPGTLHATVTYTLTDDALRLDYRCSSDKPTVVNLTNHSYFNLAGEGTGDVLGHLVTLEAAGFLAVDPSQIPLPGGPVPVDGTPFDFRKPFPIGARLRDPHPQLEIGSGYDHTFVLADAPRPEPVLAARVEEPGSGRVLEVLTTEPGVQFYSGNFLDGTIPGTSGRTYRAGAGFCLETQHFPDSPNRPDFPTTVLRPGAERTSSTIWRFSVA
jgi:aldose 1-epimerase